MNRPDQWNRLADELSGGHREGRLVYLLGPPDSGKSTLAALLAESIAGARAEPAGGDASDGSAPDGDRPTVKPLLAIIDGDPGQSVHGLPTTVGGAILSDGRWAPGPQRFVGATTPVGHFLQIVIALRRVSDQLAGLPRIVDSAGYFGEAKAEEFHYNCIEILQPTDLVILGTGDSSRRIARCFTGGPRIHTLPTAPAARKRSQEERRQYRLGRFAEYFRDGEITRFSLAQLGLHGMVPERNSSWRHRLCGFCGVDQNLEALGIVTEHVKDEVSLLLPRREDPEPHSLQVGSLRLDPEELGNFS